MAESLDLEIKGMTCSHCAETVARALRGCKGVSSAEVDLAAGRARVSGSEFGRAELARAVKEVGYGLKA